MERITSKLTTVLFVTLLLAASVTTASSQESPKVDVNALAAKGEAIANQDPLAVELRNQQPDNAARRGFDIGMAAAEGQTLPGPGKDRIRDSLPRDEQSGFSTAVSFSLERNRNAKLAETGAKIAQANPAVAEARNATTDIFYRLGFDIATGIFGDPAQGALGNTATGPGSLRIRDSLSPAGQRGFNASVKLHLGQAPPSSAPEARPRASGEVTSIDNPYKSDKVYADAGAEPTANELRCRGGAGLRFNVVEGRTNSSGEQTMYMTVYFKPAAQSASSGLNLQPGQCAFTERAVRADEPYEIILEVVYFGQTRQQPHGTPVDTSPTAAERYPDAQNVPQYLGDAKHYWSFFVHQNAPLPSGRFEASSAGRYWKPGLSKEDVIRVPTDSIRIKDNPYVLTPKKP